MDKEKIMIRPSKWYIILKKDLESGTVKKKNWKDLIEYWVYNPKKSDLVAPDGEQLELEDSELSSIIACGREHIQDDDERRLFIEGVKFTDDIEGNDLAEYLKKTGRGYYG
jgi:hypothetical protein